MDKEALIRDMEMALRAALSAAQPESYFSAKSMFGGAGFFVDGRIFAAWFGQELSLKLPPDAAQELLAVGGTSRAEMGKYVELPVGLIDQPEQLEPWVARSVDFVLTVPTKKRKKNHKH
jgi:TfoX/Sxy family transcriptional regulator of competence genes